MPKKTTELEVRLPTWDELPTFSLHLDQLLDLTNGVLEPITGDKVTKTMLHNYFKAKILVPPVRKKYQRTQLAGAIVVGLLKNIFTLSEIKAGLITMLGTGTPKAGYNNFVVMFNEQAAKVGTEISDPTSLNLKSASQATLMQYDAVQSILFWLLAKYRLNDLMNSEHKEAATED